MGYWIYCTLPWVCSFWFSYPLLETLHHPRYSPGFRPAWLSNSHRSVSAHAFSPSAVFLIDSFSASSCECSLFFCACRCLSISRRRSSIVANWGNKHSKPQPPLDTFFKINRDNIDSTLRHFGKGQTSKAKYEKRISPRVPRKSDYADIPSN